MIRLNIRKIIHKVEHNIHITNLMMFQLRFDIEDDIRSLT